MPSFRIYRMKEATRQSFRWAPHVSGAAQVKPKDYEPDIAVDASHEYAAWAMLRGSERPIDVGDLLETESGDLKICKYVGFEKALWIVPEPPAPRPAPQESQQGAI